MNVRIEIVNSVHMLEVLRPLVEDYVVDVGGTEDLVHETMAEMRAALGSFSHLVLTVIDNDTGIVLGYVYGMACSDRRLYIRSIYSLCPGMGHLLFSAIKMWGKSKNCRTVIGLVPKHKADAAARMWKAKPIMVCLEGEI